MIANIPNALTILRILLAPVFLYLIINDVLLWSIVVFAAAGLTDFLDGFLARRFDLRTELGANLDPVADKLLLSSAFIALAWKGYVPVWVCIPVIMYDAAILAAVMALRGTGKKVNISPTLSGKMTTAIQIIIILYALAGTARTHDKAFILLSVITVLVTAYSGLNYAMRELRQ